MTEFISISLKRFSAGEYQENAAEHSKHCTRNWLSALKECRPSQQKTVANNSDNRQASLYYIINMIYY
ncbi:MAG TPA: hypothetical protein VGE17_07220, partial [Methylophilus sp.]